MELSLAGLGLLTCFEVLALHTQLYLTSRKFRHSLKEIAALDLSSDHRWQVINFDLFCVDSDTLILIFNELVSNFHNLLNSFVLTDNTGLICLQCE